MGAELQTMFWKISAVKCALFVRGFPHYKAALCVFLDPIKNFNIMQLREVDRKKAAAILLPHKQQRS